MKITILWWFGCWNLWDDSILRCEIDILRGLYPHAEIHVFWWNELSKFSRQYNITNSNLPPISFYRFYRFFNIFYFFKTFHILKHTDLCVLGGGWFFSDRQRYVIAWWLRYCQYAQKHWAKVIWFCIWAGPFSYKSNKKRIKKASNIFDHIFVRDKKSYQAFIDCGFDAQKLSINIDPVFHLPSISQEKDKSIWIVLHSHEEYFVNQIYNISKNTDYYIKLIITDSLDWDINQKIQEKLQEKKCRVIVHASSQDLVKEIAKCDFVISQRLHGSIIAYSQNIPFLNIYYHHKWEELWKILELWDFSISTDMILKKDLSEFLENKESFRANMIDTKKYRDILEDVLTRVIS